MSTIEANKLKKPGSSAGVDEVGIDYVVHGTAKAWACMDGVNTVVRESLNLSSMLDNGVGLYGCNYANVMASAYSQAPDFSVLSSFRGMTPLTGYAESNCRVRVSDDSGATAVDVNHVFMRTSGRIA
ncbi:hypothetical protein [Aestuariispira ectoiniformans]|uniref:hypothetical protein n=1 Tax=Aestuariispira ectoiniformans TaxID=2775080 RepID=UPI00223B9DDD|nr:hypothetical protein [Aestuariispira ectoiniformans]